MGDDPVIPHAHRGVKFQVWIAASEYAEWHDAAFREDLVAQFKRMARSKGKKYLQVLTLAGEELLMTEATA